MSDPIPGQAQELPGLGSIWIRPDTDANRPGMEARARMLAGINRWDDAMEKGDR